MRLQNFGVFLGVFAFVASVSSANAVTVSIGLSDGSSPGLINSGNNSLITATGSFNGFDYSVTAQGNPPAISPLQLDSTTLDVRRSLEETSTGTLDVYITVSNISSLSGIQNLLSGFTVLTSNASQLALSTYLDTNNTVFQTSGLGVFSIGSFGPLGPTGLLTDLDSALATISGDISFTALYHIVTGAAGQSANAAINVSAVPGPIAGVGLPGLVMALASLVALARRRRQTASFA